MRRQQIGQSMKVRRRLRSFCAKKKKSDKRANPKPTPCMSPQCCAKERFRNNPLTRTKVQQFALRKPIAIAFKRATGLRNPFRRPELGCSNQAFSGASVRFLTFGVVTPLPSSQRPVVALAFLLSSRRDLLFSFAIFRPKIACQAPPTLPTEQNPTTTHLLHSLPFGKFPDRTAYH